MLLKDEDDHRVWIVKNGCDCCYVEIMAFSGKHPCICIDSIDSKRYGYGPRLWLYRIKQAIKGKNYGCEIDFWDDVRLGDFIEALSEAREFLKCES